MATTDFTRTTTRTLAKWQQKVTEAINERDDGALKALAWALDITLPIFDGAAQIRAQALKARAEAGARFVGGRHA